MRASLAILFLAALLSGSAAAKSRSACDVPTKAELSAVLGGAAEAPDPSTIGEETAPSCIWTTKSGARVKIEIWSGTELQVVGHKTASRYFVARANEAMTAGGARLKAIGEGGYRTTFADDQGGEIGVLKKRRFLVFAFEGVPLARAMKFATAVVRRS